MISIITKIIDLFIDNSGIKRIGFLEETLVLYVSSHSNVEMQNQYFLIDIPQSVEINSSNDIFNHLEKNITSKQHRNKVKAINRYAIVILEVEKLDTEANKIIIEVEDNEYIFNKYVLFYTKEEKRIFLKEPFINELISNKNIRPEALQEYIKQNLHSPCCQLFIRIFMKIPFLTMDFDVQELVDIEKKISDNLGDREEKYKQFFSDNENIEENIDLEINKLWEETNELHSKQD